jgi:hypothetical protein
MAYSDFVRERLRSVLRAAGLGTAASAVRSLLNGLVASKRSSRGPYVQGVTATSAVIAWMSKEPGAGVVKYGKKAPELGWEEADRRIDRRHAVAIAGLEPGSTYHYRVEGVGESWLKGGFRTAPAGEGSSFSFAVVGDSGSGGKGQRVVAGCWDASSQIWSCTLATWSILPARNVTTIGASSHLTGSSSNRCPSFPSSATTT